jgi:uncharacterized protein YkwD/LysM repeat protein
MTGDSFRFSVAKFKSALHLAALLAIVAGTLVWSAVPVAADTSEVSALAAEQVAAYINQARAAQGLRPLTVHPLLNQAAAQHMEDMIASGQYGHTGSDGSNVRQRIARTGYAIDGWAGEIWAAFQDVETSFRFWMEDPPHRDNILNRNFTEMGIAAHPKPQGSGLIIVVDFAAGHGDQPEAPVSQPAAVVADVPESGLSYTVQPGDTLSTIGERFGMAWETIAAANNLTQWSLLQIGQTLVIPGQGAASTRPDVVDAGTQASELQYIVRSGDTLSSIAERYGVSWQMLAAVNNLTDASVLHIGDLILIPQANPQTKRVYIIQPGDTVVDIGARFGVDWRQILSLNNLAPNSLLQVGRTIRLP